MLIKIFDVWLNEKSLKEGIVSIRNPYPALPNKSVMRIIPQFHNYSEEIYFEVSPEDLVAEINKQLKDRV